MNPAVRLLLLGGRWTPDRLFRAGEQGAWYDPSDLTTMWQDSAGTTAAAVGQPVGKILDKSGRGNHATQATAASRPTLLQDGSGFYYLSFDGVDDSLATGNIDFSTSDKVTVWAGLTKLSDATAAALVEFSSNSGANNGAFALFAPNAAIANYGSRSRGTVNASPITDTIYAAAHSAVLSLSASIGTDIAVLNVNRAATSVSSDQGTGNYGTYPLYVGRRGGTTLPFNGRLYGLIVRGAASDATQITAAERHMAAKIGIAI